MGSVLRAFFHKIVVLPMKDMAVLEAKRLGVITCRETESLQTGDLYHAPAQHQRAGRGHETGDLVGVIHAGFGAGVLPQPDWMTQSVRDYMNADVVTVFLDDPREQGHGLLIERHIHRVVAVE